MKGKVLQSCFIVTIDLKDAAWMWLYGLEWWTECVCIHSSTQV